MTLTAKQSARRLELQTQVSETRSGAALSELEVLEFIADEPSPVMGFISADRESILTSAGDLLAKITSKGPLYRGGFQGNFRQTFRAMGINGREYFGTIYGTYLRMRVIKIKPL